MTKDIYKSKSKKCEDVINKCNSKLSNCMDSCVDDKYEDHCMKKPCDYSDKHYGCMKKTCAHPDKSCGCMEKQYDYPDKSCGCMEKQYDYSNKCSYE